jgi:hypothetical protein
MLWIILIVGVSLGLLVMIDKVGSKHNKDLH